MKVLTKPALRRFAGLSMIIYVDELKSKEKLAKNLTGEDVP